MAFNQSWGFKIISAQHSSNNGKSEVMKKKLAAW